jgi:two-component system, cell cycle sensor histidine kinase and response regulator CckA
MRTQSETIRAVKDHLPQEKSEGTGNAGKTAEMRLLRQEDEAASQDSGMEAMGRLAGGIAHVFNNLLTAISCEVELALTRLPPDEPARKNLREIERAGERGAALARQLLAFSGRQVLQPRLSQLNNLLAGLDDRIRHIVGDSIEVKMSLDPDLHRVQIDAGQVEQAILHLVTNARDAMAEGGRLTLETRNVENPLRSAPGHWVELKVSDNGPGMSEEVRQRVFEPFFSTKQGGEVTGLGLSTTYGIITQSGGHVLADSEPGNGSRFSVFLPSAEQPADADAPGGINGKPWETILIVDDEDNVRRPLSEIMKSHGYNVLEASDGAEALEICQQHPGPIHLMVTDILMGSMSGVELAEKLSYDRAEMKVLFATGYPAGLAEGSGLDAEDAHLIKKPFTGKDLAAKIREMLESAD